MRLTFMLSSLTSRSQKSVEIPRDWRVAAVEPKEFWVLEALELGLLRDPDLEPPPPPPPTEEIEQRRESRSEEDADRSLQRCWVKWLGNTLASWMSVSNTCRQTTGAACGWMWTVEPPPPEHVTPAAAPDTPPSVPDPVEPPAECRSACFLPDAR